MFQNLRRLLGREDSKRDNAIHSVEPNSTEAHSVEPNSTESHSLILEPITDEEFAELVAKKEMLMFKVHLEKYKDKNVYKGRIRKNCVGAEIVTQIGELYGIFGRVFSPSAIIDPSIDGALRMYRDAVSGFLLLVSPGKYEFHAVRPEAHSLEDAFYQGRN